MIRILRRVAMALIAAAAFQASLALAAEEITSPDGRIALDLRVDGEGRAYYRIARDGKEVIAPSMLGFLLTDADKIERRLKLVGAVRDRHDERWEQPWGERRLVRDRYNELVVRFEEDSETHRRFAVQLRVFDDGVGFRYVFDDKSMGERLAIADELTEFNLARDGTAWWIPGGEWNRYEYLYEETPISAVSLAHTPLTFRMADGTHVAIHEAALVDFAGMWIKRTTGTRFRATLAPSGSGAARALRQIPFATPWRTIRIADKAVGLAMSDIDLNLNEPNKLGDVSWFRPHKYVGVWWGMHLDVESWGSGPKHGATTRNVKRYIDFAAKNGFAGVLVEGWNVGWDGNWFFNGSQFSFTRSYPDYDFDELARYAEKKGVSIIGHHETSGDVGNYEAQLGDALDLMAAHGVNTIKTGYVTDACNLRYVHPDGRETRECTESQAMQRHHLKVVTEAAKRKIAINPHEPVKDTGLRRTYPNWVSREGARGMEYNAWGNPPNGPSHVPTLVFTRMLSGPMDYTPGVLSLEGRGQPLQMTQARALAEYVLIYSPIQMAADLPENYAKYPRAFEFIKRVAVDWEQSLVLDGEVGDYAIIARQERGGERWFVGGGTDEQAREITLDFDFLEDGRRYRATVWKDGPNADYRGDARFDLEIESRELARGDRWTIRMAPGGGFAIEIAPQ